VAITVRADTQEPPISQFPPRRPPFQRDFAPAGPRINDRIRISPIRLIDEQGTMIGVVETDEAKRMAQEAGLDLVEIAADVRPPVCKIMDFGKYKYEQAKTEKKNRQNSKGGELKEVRLGRSMKIGVHDVELRVRQARAFLIEGNKVQIVQSFRGARELAHREIGDQLIKQVINALLDVARLDMAPRMAGRRQSAILSPDRTKIDTYKRKMAAEGKKIEASKELPPQEPESAEDDAQDDGDRAE